MKCYICGKEIEKSSYLNSIICSDDACFTKDFWNKYVNRKDDKDVARIEGCHYVIGDENSTSSFRGFGGRKFTISFNDGREVITTNLWYQGIIPEDFKIELADNAEFVKGKSEL